MSQIKSAWEIALEKTEDIQADPEKIRHDELVTQGRRLAGKYITSVKGDFSAVKKAYLNAPAQERNLLQQGIAMTILHNIALPQASDFEERIKRMKRLAELIDGQSSQLITQIGQFMGKYLQARDSLLERAKQQYKPVYQQKKERLMQKYGRGVSLPPLEQDPEFLQLVQNSYAQLTSQYQQVLDQAKEQLKQQWNL